MCKDDFEFGEELAGMVSYTDETVPAEMPAIKVEPRFSGEPIPEKVVRVTKAEDASYAPLPKPERNMLDRLYACVLWLGICGGIAMLLWWFWQNDLMAMEAAYPCILACGVIGSFGVGMNIHK